MIAARQILKILLFPRDLEGLNLETFLLISIFIRNITDFFNLMNNPIFPVRSQGGILQKMINNDNKRAIKNLPKSVTFRQVELIEEEKEYPEFARYLKKNIDPSRWLISPIIVKIKKEGKTSEEQIKAVFKYLE